MVRGKTWVVLFLSILMAGIGAFMALNYHANPLGYFTTDKGLDYNWTDDYGRSIKAKYIQNPSQNLWKALRDKKD